MTFDKEDLQFIYRQAIADYKNNAVPPNMSSYEFVAQCYLNAILVLLKRKGLLNDETNTK